MSDPNAAYIVVSLTASLGNERMLGVAQGLTLTDGGANSTIVLGLDDRVVAGVSGSTFQQLSGSLQKTAQGLSYLVGVGGISITSGSNGQIFISGSSGGGGGSGGATTVQAGANYGLYNDEVASSILQSTNSTSFVRAGLFEFNPTKIAGAGTGTRTFKFRAIGETTGPAMNVQLYNLTTQAVVVGSTMTFSSLTPTLQTSNDLTSALSAGSAVYEVQVRMSLGGTSDIVSLGYASMRSEWA